MDEKTMTIPIDAFLIEGFEVSIRFDRKPPFDSPIFTITMKDRNFGSKCSATVTMDEAVNDECTQLIFDDLVDKTVSFRETIMDELEGKLAKKKQPGNGEGGQR